MHHEFGKWFAFWDRFSDANASAVGCLVHAAVQRPPGPDPAARAKPALWNAFLTQLRSQCVL